MTRLLVAAILLTGCAGVTGPEGLGEEVSVLRVIDGDSVVVVGATGEIEVRLSGVNTPESGECHHQEAIERLAALTQGADLSLTLEGSDQFGRVLGAIHAGGTDVALQLVQEGHGVAEASAPNADDLIAAEAVAQDRGLGMWAPDACGSGALPAIGFDLESIVTDPPGPDDANLAAETMVVRNDDTETVDLTGWVLRDGSSRHRYHFPEGTRLEPGARLEIDGLDPGWSPGGTPVWSNRGDIAILLDPSGRVVARWRYRR